MSVVAMTHMDFQTQMNRIIDTFGKNPFGTERCAMIWREASKIDYPAFTRVVDGFIANSRQPPLVCDFKEAVSFEIGRRWDESKNKPMQPFDPSIPVSCENCQDSGTVLSRLIGVNGVYAFRCTCDVGNLKRRDIPVWRFSYSDRYEVI